MCRQTVAGRQRSPSALGALTCNYTVSATVNDKAGNPGSTSHNLAVDTTAPVLTINTVAGDDIINDAEHAGRW
ncbi:hypothetical protein ECZU34_34100 [Escherichia coli]|nr:hypothetical protein ECZU34_34100 [Escherichia coli]